MPLIGLTGENGAGKTSIAHVLATQCRQRYARLGFADPIRAAVAAALGETVDRAFSHPFKDLPHSRAPNGVTPRALAICWAEAARAAFGDRCWVAALAARAALCGPRVVIDDLRFRVELEWVHKNRGFIVSVGEPPWEFSLSEIALVVPRCPTEDAGPEARQIWLAETVRQILDLARGFPPPPWWHKET
jgi:hypothetical protein